MSLSTRPKLRLLTLCALYAAQGIPYGFITITLAAYMADQGLGTSDVGNIIFYSTLPWAFKWIWGPVIDIFGIQSMGRRRPWIIFAQMMMAATMLLMVFVGDLTTSIVALSWMAALHNIFGSLQDVAVDALAIDLLKEDERGQANGLMWGSKYFGVAIGGAGLGTIAGYFGLRTAILVQVLILLAIMLLPLLNTERAGERVFPWSDGARQLQPGEEVAESLGDGFRSLLRAFSLRSTLLGVLLAVLVNVGSGIIAAFIPVFFLTEAVGWTKETYTQVQGGPAVLFGVAGAAAGGIFGRPLRRKDDGCDRRGGVRPELDGFLLHAPPLAEHGLFGSPALRDYLFELGHVCRAVCFVYGYFLGENRWDAVYCFYGHAEPLNLDWFQDRWSPGEVGGVGGAFPGRGPHTDGCSRSVAIHRSFGDQASPLGAGSLCRMATCRRPISNLSQRHENSMVSSSC